MSLRHALLVTLLQNEGTGYEITKRFDGSVGFFWQASHQQIYKELAKMTAEGYVTFIRVEQEGKPAKKVYRVTPQGHSELERWMAEPVSNVSLRDPFLVKLYAADLVPTVDMLTALRGHRAMHTRILDTYRDIERNHFPAHVRTDSKFRYAYFTLRNGIIHEEAWLRWADEVITTLVEDASAVGRE